ncbi:tRNA uridine-5-carboxymethylaminomethyl(34) synthesis GTPase MnmE [Terrimonas rubra]|uniref:tRNA modification GTPase MnmE n=1 Tax=Terrimonas rubra TaxID=1035890 RepID=A0ABW6A6G8_9BACT
MKGLTKWTDTIVAIATPPGLGALGIIRLSGSEAVGVVNALFPSKDLAKQASHTLHVGFLQEGETVLDEVVVSLYKAPRSYTGEDIVEISCHGSPYILQQVVHACIQQGARLATQGEFTQRAFLNNKMDLAQAEAVADLIAADTEAMKQTAMRQLRGGFSHDLDNLREQLINFAALIELELDFSQEDVEFADRTALQELITSLKAKISELVSSFKLGNVIKNGVSVAIIGKPNAGKSTLLNALLNEERAIVSDIAGTTRDTIEETLNINGVLFRLIDTAGIREHTTDVIEQIGVGRSLAKMREANVVVYLFDVQDTDTHAFQQQIGLLEKDGLIYLPVGNKADSKPLASLQKEYVHDDIIFLSAKDKTNIQQLKQALYDIAVGGTINTESTIVTNARHHAALLKIHESLQDIDAGMQENLTSDLLVLDIRRCLHYLSEITGRIEVDRDILGTIFGKFCIGK